MKSFNKLALFAGVAELADAQDLGFLQAVFLNPLFPTKYLHFLQSRWSPKCPSVSISGGQ